MATRNPGFTHQLRLVVNIPLFPRFYISQVIVWDFFHRQYQNQNKGGRMVRLEMFFPKQFYCCGSQCCLKCVRLGCDAVSASIVLSSSCLGSCLPTCLPVSQLAFQPGMLCPAPWSCLRSCLPTCLPVCQLVLQPGMLCPAPWSCLCLVCGLVSQSASLFFSLGWLCPAPWSCLRSCLPVCQLVPQTVYCWGSQCCLECVHLGWVAVSASLVLCFSCLRSCLPTCLPAGLGCGVCGPGLSQEFYVRFVQLFGVYGGVILYKTHPKQKSWFQVKKVVNCILFI